MTSPLNAVRDSITTLWEATTPPDRTETGYKRLVEIGVNLGVAADRSFRFKPGRIERIVSQSGGGWTDREWNFEAELRLSHVGRGHDEMNDAIENEANLLFRQIEVNDSWSTGVISVQTLESDYDWEGEEFSSDALVLLGFRAHIQERD